MIRPSINAVAETYELARRNPELGTAVSSFTGERVNRFLHIASAAVKTWSCRTRCSVAWGS